MVAVVSVGAAFFFPVQTQKTLAPETVSGNTEVIIQDKLKEQDTDEDGLKDWEESLWLTDIKIKDTDGDGTDDGKEVAAGRNPAVKAPNDNLKPNAEAKKDDAPAAPLTQTSKISRELFAKYMSLKQNGQELTPEVEAELIESIININNFAKTPEYTYEFESFRISKDSPELLKRYGNTIGSIIKTNAVKGIDSKGRPVHELLILERALNTGNAAELELLGSIITSYENIVTALLKVEVPQGASQIHLSLINNFNLTIEADKSFVKLFDDPAAAMTGLVTYKESSIGATKGFRDLRTYFSNMQVRFGDGEAGYIITTGLKL
ncbi:MAG: hypothetical protein M3Q73_03015 [bacterium]|nr:hypothetical protein [bacterium]